MHVLRIRYFCLLAILLSTSNVWAYTPIPQSPMAQRVHPRLHLTPETIPALRNAIAAHYAARFQSYVDWTITETITNEQDKFNIISDAAHNLLRALMVHQAFISVLGPVPGIQYMMSPEQLGRRAIHRLLAQLRAKSQVSFVGALVYDWTYHLMTPAERAECAKLLAAAQIKHNASDLKISLTAPVFEPDWLFSSNYYESFSPWYLGLALWGDGLVDAQADHAVDTFTAQMLNFGHLDAINFAGRGGGWDEWSGYSNWHPQSHALKMDAWRTATGENYIAAPSTVDGNALKSYAKFIYYAVDPHKYHDTTYSYVIMGGAQTTDTKITDNRSQKSLLFFLPRLFAGAKLPLEAGLVRHFLEFYEQEWVHDTYPYHYLWGFLGVPPTVLPVTPQQTGFPKSNWSENIGLFLARTGFDSPADSVFFVADGHFGFALGRGVQKWPGFGLVKFGPLVGTRSVGHRGLGNLSDYPGGHEMNIVYFEGGHELEYKDVVNRLDLRQALSGQGNFDRGGIEQIVTQEDVFYHVRVDRSRSFVPGVRHQREYVWLPGADAEQDADVLVVYDRTAAPSKPHWVYHVPWQPQVLEATSTVDLTLGRGLSGRIGTAYEGAYMVVKELNALGDRQDNEKGTADFTGGAGAHGVLFARTLLPATARIEVTRVAEFDSVNVLIRQGDLAIKSHRWQVDVTPLDSQPTHRFLHVFETADANVKTAMVPTTLLDSPSGMEGVFIERQSANHPNFVVLFKNTDENVESTQYTVTGQGQVRHVITGLVPAAMYKIEELTGGLVLTKATEQGRLWDYRGVDINPPTGTLWFESTLAGTHTYLVTRLAGASPLPPLSPTVESFTVMPAIIGLGDTATLAWSTANATSVLLEPGIGSGLATTGSVMVSPTVPTMYTLTAIGAGGTATATVTVTIAGLPPPIIASFTATPADVATDGTATLAWSTTNATEVTIEPAVGSGLAATGSVVVQPAVTTTYTLTATSPGGTATRTTTIIVRPVQLWLEAEAGLLHAPMAIGANAEASAGHYVWVPEGQANVFEAVPGGGMAQYTFTVPAAGTYVIWGRVGANAVGTGSFFLTMDGEASSVWTVPSSGGTGTEMVTGVSPADYVVTTLQVGDTLYIDRNDTIMSMPAELDGLVGIKTADRDTSNRSGAFLTFTVAQDATLYVAYDARATRFPDWLTDNYRRTNLVIGTTIAPLTVWQREVLAGPIKVPGNERGTPRGVDTNYIVLLASRSPQIWVWDQAMGDTIPILFLNAGTHTLRIQQRESGTKLDRLLITNDLEFTP